MVVFIILFGGFCGLLYWMWTRRRYYYVAWQIRGPIGYPFFGVIHKLIDREKYLYSLMEYEKSYGRVMVSWLGPIPFIVVADPKVAQIILTSPDCVNKSVIYHAVQDGTGTGLFCSKNPDWSSHRKLLNPTFGHKVLLSFFPIFNCESNSLLVKLNNFVGTGEVDIRYIIQECTMRIAIQTTMGQAKNSEYHYKDLLDCYKCILITMLKMICAPWLGFKIVLKMTDLYQPYIQSKNKIRTFTKNQANDRLTQKEKEPFNNISDNQEEFDTKKNCQIFIDRAIDLFKSGEFTWRDVEDESNQIVFGAFETTANTLGYVLIMLSMFPKYQDKLYEEVKAIIPSKDSNIDLTYEDIKLMIYMDMVLNETMRVMAPVPVVGREIAKDIKLPNGVVLPQGLQVLIDIFNMHRDPEYWGPDATIFNPDNFLPANMADKHPYTFIPFTKGLRNCIGWRYGLLSAKIILSKLVRKYRFTTKFKFHDLHFIEDITIKIKNYPLLEVHLREI